MIKRNEVSGTEFDWFAIDENDFVAFFSSAGSGQVPPSARDSGEDFERLASALGIGTDHDSWRRAAEAGPFAYDAPSNGGPYRLQRAPARPLLLDELPPTERSIVQGLRYAGSFGVAELRYCESAFQSRAV